MEAYKSEIKVLIKCFLEIYFLLRTGSYEFVLTIQQ